MGGGVVGGRGPRGETDRERKKKYFGRKKYLKLQKG
jgi:hypothetical protein